MAATVFEKLSSPGWADTHFYSGSKRCSILVFFPLETVANSFFGCSSQISTFSLPPSLCAAGQRHTFKPCSGKVGLTRSSPKIPFNLNYSMSLWYSILFCFCAQWMEWHFPLCSTRCAMDFLDLTVKRLTWRKFLPFGALLCFWEFVRMRDVKKWRFPQVYFFVKC